MGRGAQAGAIREEGPGRLCGRTASRLLAARLSLDRRRTRTLVVRTLLADAVFEIPAAAEGPATGEAARRAHPRFSRVTVADDVPYSCRPNAGAGADPDSNPSPLPVHCNSNCLKRRGISPCISCREPHVWSRFDDASCVFHSLPSSHTYFLLASSYVIPLSLSLARFLSLASALAFFHAVPYFSFAVSLHLIAAFIHLRNLPMPMYNNHNHPHHPSSTYVITLFSRKTTDMDSIHKRKCCPHCLRNLPYPIPFIKSYSHVDQSPLYVCLISPEMKK